MLSPNFRPEDVPDGALDGAPGGTVQTDVAMPDVQVPEKKRRGRPSKTKGIKHNTVDCALILTANSRRSSASITSRSSTSSTASLALGENRRVAGGRGGRVIAGGRARQEMHHKTTVAGAVGNASKAVILVEDLRTKIEELQKSRGVWEYRARRQQLIVARYAKQAGLLSNDLKAAGNAIRQYTLNNCRRAGQPTASKKTLGVAAAALPQTPRVMDVNVPGAFASKGPMSKQLSHSYATDMVREMLSAAHAADEANATIEDLSADVDSRATCVLKSFINHHVTKRLLKNITSAPLEESAGMTRQLAVDAQIVERLKEALQVLKNETADPHAWHAYSAILTAIAPEVDNTFDFNRTLDRLAVGPDALLKAVQRRDSLFNGEGDDSVWYQEKKAKNKSAFVMKYASHVPTVLGFWHTQTQASSNTSDLKWEHNRDTRGNHRHLCLQC